MKKIALVGLGYVELPLARLFATKYTVVVFDIKKTRVAELMFGKDSTLEVDDSVLQPVLLDHASVENEIELYCSSNLYDIKDSIDCIVLVPDWKRVIVQGLDDYVIAEKIIHC